MSEDSAPNSGKDSPMVRPERDNYFSSTTSNSGSQPFASPSLRAKSSSKLRRNKSKPHLKRASSIGGSTHYKLVFSVDDDVNDDIIEEPENDQTITPTTRGFPKADRDYLEGYNDALRSLYQKRGRSLTIQDHNHDRVEESNDRSDVETPTPGRFKAVPVAIENLPPTSSSNTVESELIKNLLGAEDKLKTLQEREEGVDNEHDATADESSFLIDNVADADEANTDADSVHSSSSSETLESLNLRERQDAINSTHPFGIKIWKPSLYKKKRSVATRAEEDIHDFDLREPTYRIFWGVYLCNIIWSLTFGLALYLVCLIGCALVFVFSGFGIHKSSRPYVKLLYSVAKYWLFPFGKFVLLNKDKNYLEEDELDGRSLVEFQRWREQEEGRLFFAPPRRYTTSDSRPLLKDHKGRTLNETYNLGGPQQAEGSSSSNNNNTNNNTNENSNDNNKSSSSSKTPMGISQSENATNNNANETSMDTSAIDDEDDSNDQDYDDDVEINDIKKRFFGRGSWSSGRFMFYVYFYVVLQPLLFILSLFCWLFVFTIPMAKITDIICDHLRRHPLALHFELEKEYYDSQANEGFKKKRKHQSIIMCTYRCCGLHYYKYTIDGTNIFFINLLATVIFVIFDFYFLKEFLKIDSWYTESSFVFGFCLLSVIPLAYFIGQAVASISAQSSMGVGAVINAFFSTVVEIFLYCVALNQSKGKLVEGSLIGSILGGVLLLPGLSMCGGALKRKTQRYNPRSAGVSSTMLLFAMVIMFAPSMFYQIYGSYEIRCSKCSIDVIEQMARHGIPEDCTKCRFIQPTLKLDALYDQIIKPFSLIVANALFIAYVCGLYFTLRTHASLIWATNSHEVTARKEDHFTARSPSVISLDIPKPAGSILGKSNANTAKVATSFQLPSPSVEIAKQRFPNPAGKQQTVTSPSSTVPGGGHSISSNIAGPHPSQKPTKKASIVLVKDEGENEEGGGHDAPNWSRKKSTVILLGSTIAYAIIAEILVDCVDDVLVDFPIDPKFLGLTVFALVPNTTEFLNAISFAVSGNVALSMEIGSAYALQVVLIQIPCLVIYTIYKNFKDVNQLFPLVFPRWDIIATLMSIFLFTYIYAEGKSNYFKGVILILIYFVVMIGFWFNDKIGTLESFGTTVYPGFNVQSFPGGAY